MKNPILAFRQKLKKNITLSGAAITFSDPLITEALAPSVDFLWYDMEHSRMDFDVLKLHMMAARGQGKPAIVRVTTGDLAQIKPVLDGGADGIVVPQVSSVAEVEQIVAECRYTPEGRRGFGPRIPSGYGRENALAYIKRANRELFVSVMIETKSAVEEIEKIVKVKGLDSVVIGPMDLSGSLGRLGHVEHPVCVKAQQRVIQAAHKAGLPVGAGMGANSGYASTLAKRGVNWMQVGSDFEYMINFYEKTDQEISLKIGRKVFPRKSQGAHQYVKSK